MPNWCENELIITGDKASLAKFKKEARDGKRALSLDKLHKMPKGLEDKDDDGVMPEWYAWCIKNWGTKWDVTDVGVVSDDEEFLVYEFLSAWTPPTDWLRKVSADYPGLAFTLKYDEPGVGFMGAARAKNGELTNQDISYT